MRSAQIGAVYAALAHETTGASDPATIVLPTGVGKSEVMITLFAHFVPRALLVLVPTDALRTQIGHKFAELGLLRQFGMLPSETVNPVVCLLRHGIQDASEARSLTEASNVIVATPQVLHQFSPTARRALSDGCDALYIDEAHHVPAATWSQVRDDFDGRTVLQFTATPFRADGRRLGGRIVYAYPLGKAYEDGYFAKIDYLSVFDLRDPDQAVAVSAVERLRHDLDRGLDHILFARAKTQDRAEEILQIYRRLAPDLNPQVIHSGLPAAQQRASVSALRETPRASRILVCVDMFGEGFDLPQLKVAALHDPHRSLGITLQFIGRFARTSGDDLGSATVVAMRPDRLVDHRLVRLFAEDADWNDLITDLSSASTAAQREQEEFESAFAGGGDALPVRALRPRLGAVVYRVPTSQGWEPERLPTAFPADSVLFDPAINSEARVAWVITATQQPVGWAEGRAFEELSIDLHLLHWDESRGLLYVNSSAGGWPDRLADAVSGQTAERVTGLDMYRVMAGLERPVPLNLGLLDLHSRDSRYLGLMGANVAEGLSQADEADKSQTHMYVSGYREGEWDGVGASANGRIWRTSDATVAEWTAWVNRTGRRILDDNADIESILRGFIRPERLESRPALVPLTVEWPWELVATRADGIRVSDGHGTRPLAQTDLEVTSHNSSGPIEIRLTIGDRSHSYELQIGRQGLVVVADGLDPVTVTSGRDQFSFSEFSTEAGLLLLLEDNAVVTAAGLLMRPNKELSPYPVDRLRAIDWGGVDLSAESMGHMDLSDPSSGPPLPLTVQARMLDELMNDDSWDVIINDDGPGEVADLVALARHNDSLRILLVHCKYAATGGVARRIDDLYEVCGQASKSTRWFRDPSRLVQRLIDRERDRQRRHSVTGLHRGSETELYDLVSQAPLLARDFAVAVAQPGLTSAAPSTAQLAILASTDDYVRTTSNNDLAVYCSGPLDRS